MPSTKEGKRDCQEGRSRYRPFPACGRPADAPPVASRRAAGPFTSSGRADRPCGLSSGARRGTREAGGSPRQGSRDDRAQRQAGRRWSKLSQQQPCCHAPYGARRKVTGAGAALCATQGGVPRPSSPKFRIMLAGRSNKPALCCPGRPVGLLPHTGGARFVGGRRTHIVYGAIVSARGARGSSLPGRSQ